MLYFNPDKSSCTSCAACYSVCPQKCIQMVPDKSGFLYPIARDKCIHCKRCEMVCPAFAEIKPLTFHQKAYAAISKNNEVWKTSTSGGAFTEICNVWDDNNDTLICGASWDSFDVAHTCVVGKDNTRLFRKSKYVASAVNDCFIQIKNHIMQGKKAVFCGTPCQVAGLKSYLGKDFENLLLIDLICHGVGSPRVFKDCIRLMSEQFHMDIESYEFRAKPSPKWFCSKYISRITGPNKSIYVENDQFMQLFIKQTCLRESCGKNCRYRNENRQGDITIADFNNVEFVFPQLSGEGKNYSSIIVNSDKGMRVVNDLRVTMKLYDCDIEVIKRNNPLFFRQTSFSEDRYAFFREYENDDTILNDYVTPAIISKISFKRKIFYNMPIFIRRPIVKLIRGAKNGKKQHGGY